MKHTTDTSNDALVAVQHDRARREALVLDGLRRYRRAHGADPSGYELLKFLQIEHADLDHNSVRPRLTELETRGGVAKGAKRRCAVTGKTVYTWTIVSSSPFQVPVFESGRRDDARQPRLL